MRATRSTRSRPRALRRAAVVGVERARPGPRRRAHVGAQQRGRHLRVARGAGAAQPLALALARREHAARAPRPRSSHPAPREVAGGGPLDVDEQVEAVEQRAAQPPGVAREVGLGAAAPRATAAKPHGHGFVAATSMKRVGKTRVRWPRTTATRPSSSGWRSASSARARELRQLVEEQHAVVREARLARAPGPRRRRRGPTPRSCGAAPGTGARSTRAAAVVQARDAVDPRDLERLGARERRQDRRQPPREHRLADAGRPSSSRLWPPAAAIVSARDRRRRGRGRRRGRRAAGRGATRRGPGSGGGGRSPPRSTLGDLGSVPAAMTSSPSTSAASAARSRGTIRPVEPARARRPRRRRARRGTAAARRRARARRRPRGARAPRAGIWPLAASTPTAIARSNPGPTLRRCAGARLTVMRRAGNSKPEFRIAARTRSRASRTARSASPTIVKAGRPGADVDLDGDEARVEAVDGEGGDAGEHGRHARGGRVTAKPRICDDSARCCGEIA